MRQRLSHFMTLSLLVVTFSHPAYALTCQQVKQLTGVYLKMHFSYSEFTDELSRRVLDSFLKTWDPGKVYFLASDAARFEKEYATRIDDLVKENNCKFIEDIMSTYNKRFEERQVVIEKFINGEQDFKKDEYLEIDRKKMPYAETTEELDERWRKRVKFQIMQLKESISEAPKLKEKMLKRYALAKKRHKEITSDEVYASFLNTFAMSLDPHSDYMSPDQLEDFRIHTKLSLEGIGAVLRTEDGYTTIQSLVPGGAAALTGKIKTEDKIISVAQGKDTPVDVIDMDLREVVKLIRGTRGTEVRLTLLREEKGKTVQLIVPVIREKVQLTDRAAKSRVIKVTGKDGAATREYRIGVVNLPTFYMDFEGRQNRVANFKSSSADMLKEIKSLKAKNIDAMIVDLRNNGGGSLDESINVAGLFINKGPVVQIKGPDGSTAVQEDKDAGVAYDGPLIVMTNRQSASASEIFAGAIQDYGRGPIVGDSHTFGKGTVQNLNDISEKLGAVKVTISKFYRPSGSSTQLKGVEADIVLPDLMDELEIGEKYYDYALPWEKIKDSNFAAVNQVSPYVAQLKSASTDRVKKDSGFQEVFADIKTYKDGEAERSRVSLKEKTAEEKAKDAAKQEAEKAKRKKQEDVDGEIELKLKDDFHLQETARIAADYIQLQNKHSTLTSWDIPEAKEAVAMTAPKVKADKKGKVKDRGHEEQLNVKPSTPKELIK